MSRLKASQRRTLKHRQGRFPGGARPASKPIGRRDLPDSYVSGPTVVYEDCAKCLETFPREEFEWLNKQGKLSGSRFSWCKACRAAVTEASCARCKNIKTADSFLVQAGGRSIGLASYCFDCQKVQYKESIARARNVRQAMSDAHRVRQPGDNKIGQCRAYVNLGSLTRIGVRCSRAAATGGYCLTHASAQERRVGTVLRAIRSGTMSFGSEDWRRQYEKRQERELAASLEASEELRGLVEAQKKDGRFSRGSLPWQTSLDAPFGREGDARLLDFIDHSGQLHIGSRYTPDFADAVCEVVDRRREIDTWADEVAA